MKNILLKMKVKKYSYFKDGFPLFTHYPLPITRTERRGMSLSCKRQEVLSIWFSEAIFIACYSLFALSRPKSAHFLLTFPIRQFLGTRGYLPLV